MFFEFFFHRGADFLVEDALISFVGVALVVAAGEVPEEDGVVLGGVESGDGLEGFAIGEIEHGGGVALNATGRRRGDKWHRTR